MPSQLSIHAVHEGGMRVQASDGRHSVLTDYPRAAGEVPVGLTSLQLLLASLATCSANSVMLLLKREPDLDVAGLEVDACGTRRDQHPMGFSAITLEFQVKGRRLRLEPVSRAIALSEEKFCPVWNMLKHGTEITATFQLLET